MTKITKIDKNTLVSLRPDIDAALAELGARLGLKFHAGNGSYGDNRAHFKLEIEVDDPAVQEAAARKEFEQYCGLYDLEPSDFGIEFKANGKTYRVCGLAMNRSKFPIKVLHVEENKVVLFGAMVAANIKLARTAKAA